MKKQIRRKRHKLRLIPSILLLVICTVILIEAGILLGHTFAQMGQNNRKTNHHDHETISVSADKDLPGQLSELAAYDKRIFTILDHLDAYPEVLLKKLVADLDLLDFVLGYPVMKGNTYADTIGNMEQGQIPLLLQWDQRWGYANYGDDCIAVNGCLPTALSMVIAGLRNDMTITPYTIAHYADKNAFYVPGVGSSWDLIDATAAYFHISCEELPLYKESVLAMLKNNHPIICSMLPGDFTSTGHFIVLTGMVGNKIKVNDPNSIKRSHQLWDYDTLASQINNLWVFYL